jgi:uncharacterized phage protein (TIGR01671 family)
MREIKFRIWYWYQAGSGGNPDGNIRAGYWETDHETCYINDKGELYQDSNDTKECCCHSIDSLKTENYVICQYTGLKDKNGKEIYEGDIIKTTVIHGTSILPVVWHDSGFYVQDGWGDWWPNQEYREVIGNIYENPELLEKNETP